MDPLTALAIALGSAWGSGINLYATILVMGGLDLFGVIELPADLQTLASPWVLGAAALLYVVEFVADKVPGVDSAWDAIHTFIRIPAGAVMAAGAIGGIEGIDGDWQIIAALIAGGAVATGSHAIKAGSRIMINASPEPFSNWAASLIEDVVVFTGISLAVLKPTAFFIAFALFMLLMIWLVPKVWRGIAKFLHAVRHPRDLGGAYRSGATK